MGQTAVALNDGSPNRADHLKQHCISKRSDMSWHDYLVELLRLGASLEHALMVQYLYAAYSLGGPQVPEKHRPMVYRWQQALLTIAREEMGHLLTVQNLLTFLGSPVCFTRNEFPWTIQYFNLEPLTKSSLACFVYAEMPEAQDFPEKRDITEIVRKHLGRSEINSDAALVPICDIYAEIISLLGDTVRLPESALRPDSYTYQATWDDWGRGYKPDPRPLDPEGNQIPYSPTPDKNRAIVLIDSVATRTQALAALKALSLQGEGPEIGSKENEPAHFDRLIEIFRELTAHEHEGWSPSLPVPVNPSTVDSTATRTQGYIDSEHSRNWADLFNLRYRILLTSFAHTFRLARVTRSDEPSVRAVMMHRVFGEMYNLKTIARILVHLPLTDGDDSRRAGPPFELPRDHSLPTGDMDCWCLHLDTLHVADKLCRQILSKETAPQSRAYIETLMDIDRQTSERIRQILSGFGSSGRYTA